MKKELIKIEGMNCGHCIMSVKKELSKLDLEIEEIKIGSAEIEYDETKIKLSQIESAIEEAGYRLIK